ncbi:MAG: chordopoxvirus fusion protein [Dictyoglomaceae bacterium]
MAISKEELYPIIREIVLQELEERIPIHKEIVDLKSAIERLTFAQERTEKRIEELAEAQRKTEERLNALVEAQKRTEERLDALAEAQRKTEERLNALAEAQKRTEERLERLEKVVEGLIESQKKAEERLERLETIVESLIEAQRKTEEEIRELTLVVKNMQRQINGISKELGGLSHAVGFQLEDRAYRSLPSLLKRDFGIEVKERLVRKFIKNKRGENMEINILGKGERDGKEIYIVGEAKANLSIRHVVDFIDRLKDIKEVITGEIFPIVVTYMTEPEVEEFAKSKGISVYYSYDFEPIY